MVAISNECEAGTPAKELARLHGINVNTLYNWRKKYGGMDVNEARRLKHLEEENRKLKRIVADQVLDITALKDVLSKKW
jgi:putative transposase